MMVTGWTNKDTRVCVVHLMCPYTHQEVMFSGALFVCLPLFSVVPKVMTCSFYFLWVGSDLRKNN